MKPKPAKIPCAIFTFFLKDESIVEIKAADKNEAMRELCRQRGNTWYWMLQEIIDCLSADVTQIPCAFDPAVNLQIPINDEEVRRHHSWREIAALARWMPAKERRRLRLA